MTTDRDSGRTVDAARDASSGDAAGAPAAGRSGGTDSGSSTAARPATGGGAGAGLVFDDPFDRPSSDDTDRGWGDAIPGGASDDDFTRFLNEKPPHHL